jgi:pimeloyl-ACP methyl ester carboxylesterase
MRGFVLFLALAAVAVYGSSISEALRSNVKFEFPIAGSVERLQLEATDKNFLASSVSNTAYWYTQRVDHFSATDHRTFHQRFFVYEPPVIDPHATIILYVGGQHALTEVPEDDVRLIAKEWSSPVVILEHRYFGDSQPLGDLSTDNLQYLTTRQALADLASFRDFFQNVYNQIHHFPVGTSHPWFTFGIGYGGALASWFRLKYPHLVKGAVASSATVTSVIDLHEYDQQVYHSLGKECGDAVAKAVRGVTELMSSSLDRAHLDDLLKTEGLSDDDLVLFVSDAVSLPVQYGRAHEMCATFLRASRAGESLIHALNAHIQDNFQPIFAKHDLRDWSMARLRDTRADPGSTARQIWYTKCTEMGQFATAAGSRGSGVRSSRLTTTYFHARCQQIFGKTIWPDVDETTRSYGRDEPGSSNVFFINGAQDPLQHASVLHSVRESEPVFVVQGYNAGHAVDLRGCPSGPFEAPKSSDVCQDQQSILDARKATLFFMRKWLAEA